MSCSWYPYSFLRLDEPAAKWVYPSLVVVFLIFFFFVAGLHCLRDWVVARRQKRLLHQAELSRASECAMEVTRMESELGIRDYPFALASPQ